MHGQQLDGRHADRQQVIDERRMRASERTCRAGARKPARRIDAPRTWVS
jgi:hypothetical protein